MPKKTFKNNTAHLDRFFSEPQEPHNTHDTDVPQRTHEPQKTEPKYYRLNLKLKAEYREYLEHASWLSKKSITQYVNDLIGADKDTKDTQATYATMDTADT